MNIPLLIATLRHLRVTQVKHQLKYQFFRPKIGTELSPAMTHTPIMQTEPIFKPLCYHGEGRFTFLNITDTFHGWNMGDHGALWTYNLNYMDWLEQEDITIEECEKWIDRFIDDLTDNHIGQDPYPIALRIINWIKFFCKHPECQSKRRNDSMYAQTLLLERKLEYHLLGNHLLEDSYALTIAAIYFHDFRLFRKASGLLRKQLNEQILPDGAHYEQSPMYHCILLDRLLDCINFSLNNYLFDGQTVFTDFLCQQAARMLGHLQSIIYADGSIPLLNDAANGIAPTATQLFRYAERLGIRWQPLNLGACGYRKLSTSSMELIADIGNISATYQPGHSHADTFSYELRIGGQQVIVDTGISTYNKNQRRQYERSTAAHNTVSVDGLDSSQVWGGFRVGKRATVTVLQDTFSELIARHDGFGRNVIHQRRFLLTANELCIEDHIIGQPTHAVSYLHFSPQLHATIVSREEGIIKVGPATIKIEGFSDLKLTKNSVSTEYNHLQVCDMLIAYFSQQLKYTISQI
jgi:hypothetical protein